MSTKREMLLLMGLRARPAPEGGVVLTRKFVEGVEAFTRRWEGRVTVLYESTDAPPEDLDPVVVRPRAAAFGLEPLPAGAELAKRIARAAVVHSNVFFTDLAAVCSQAGTPLVYVSESTLKTLLQSLALDFRNPIVRARKQLWAVRHEPVRRAAIAAAAGLQCNGVPTYREYSTVSPSAMLFFDSRISEADLALEETLERRFARLREGGPLRLLFSGRLMAIKGPMDLLRCAAALVERRFDFTLDVCGAGPEEPAMRAFIERAGLASRVRLHGALDFHEQLLPFVSQSADLFVCCHLQGDPSCTYLETMACGVPIIGYDNEAWAGLSEHAGLGWTTQLGKPRRLAERIIEMSADRAALEREARRALAFAREHLFDAAMDRRVAHIDECSRAGRRPGAAKEPSWT